MALLLAMYQKMRLIREKNQVTLDLTKYQSNLDRVTKNIERVQKRYTSLFAQLDSQAKMMQSQATVQLQNMMGLGTNSMMNVNSPYASMSGFVYNVMGQMFQKGIPAGKDANGKATSAIPLGTDLLQKMMADYMANGGKFLPEIDKKTNTQAVDANGNPKYQKYSYQEVQAFTQTMSTGQMYQQQAQQWVQTKSNEYTNNVSIWLESAKAQLEAEQDAQLEPLNYQQTMWELEKTQADAKLERIRQNIETYSNLASEEAKNSAPTFGLR